MIAVAAISAAAAVWLAAEAVAGRTRSPAGLLHRVRTSRVGRADAGGPGSRRARPTRQVWLSQAGAAVTPGQFWAVTVGLFAVTFLVLYLVGRTVVVAALPAAGLAAAPYAYWSAQRRRRANARFEAWPDALRHVIGRLESGASTLHDALEELSVSGPVALRPPMARYVRLSARVGYRHALEAVRAELADPISDPVLLTFGVAVEEGTDQVVRILTNLAHQIQGDLQLAEKVRTLQTQSRVATWAVFTLPYALLVFLCATQSFYRSFFSQPIGLVVVGAGAGLSVVGFSLARRLGRPISTTERVFVRTGASA